MWGVILLCDTQDVLEEINMEWLETSYKSSITEPGQAVDSFVGRYFGVDCQVPIQEDAVFEPAKGWGSFTDAVLDFMVQRIEGSKNTAKVGKTVNVLDLIWFSMQRWYLRMHITLMVWHKISILHILI